MNPGAFADPPASRLGAGVAHAGGAWTDRPGPGLRTLLLGLGNDILGDDSIGLRVVRELRRTHLVTSPRSKAPEEPPVTLDIVETSEAGLALLDAISGYDEVILVDAVRTGAQPAGYLHEVEGEDLPQSALGSPHFLGVPETLALGHALGLPMPARVLVFAVEVADPHTLSTSLTPAVEKALPHIVRTLRDRLPR